MSVSIFDTEKLHRMQEKKIKKHTIMIVDDEEAQLSSIKSMLLEYYNIITARDGQEALDIIKKMEQPEEISVIISDQRMPKITGVQFFEKIKEILPNTLRIILTAYDDKDVIIDSINKAKVYEFILKSFEPNVLKLRVKRAVEAFEGQQQLDIHRRSLEEKTKELEQKNKELKELSLTDPVTGLRNPRYLDEFIPLDISRVRRNYEGWLKDMTKPAPLESDLVFFWLDLDRLKDLNDKHGHEAGNNVLKQLAEIFKKECRKSDVLVRKGGDEFLIVNRFADNNQAHELAERLRKEVEKKRFDTGEGIPINITCSIGFACYPFIRSQPDEVEWNDVVKIADMALYAAKNSGRNAWVGLFSTDKTKPGNLYQETEKGKKKMLLNIEQLLENGELDITTSLPNKKSIKWRKPGKI
jgi:two-component system cell cycle response regulator